MEESSHCSPQPTAVFRHLPPPARCDRWPRTPGAVVAGAREAGGGDGSWAGAGGKDRRVPSEPGLFQIEPAFLPSSFAFPASISGGQGRRGAKPSAVGAEPWPWLPPVCVTLSMSHPFSGLSSHLHNGRQDPDVWESPPVLHHGLVQAEKMPQGRGVSRSGSRRGLARAALGTRPEQDERKMRERPRSQA